MQRWLGQCLYGGCVVRDVQNNVHWRLLQRGTNNGPWHTREAWCQGQLWKLVQKQCDAASQRHGDDVSNTFNHSMCDIISEYNQRVGGRWTRFCINNVHKGQEFHIQARGYDNLLQLGLQGIQFYSPTRKSKISFSAFFQIDFFKKKSNQTSNWIWNGRPLNCKGNKVAQETHKKT